jgi:uncharacterized protein (DUF58 family)
MTEKKEALLDPEFLRRLERLRIQARRAFPGVMRGERRSTRRGASVEFSDFRKYEAGDDFRHVDWNIYARLDRLMLRQFVEEEDVRIEILLDQSRSMHFGEPVSKFDFARRAAAALSFIAVGSLDRFGVATFDSALKARVRALRGRGHLISVLSFLEGLDDSSEEAEPDTDQARETPVKGGEGQTNLGATLRGYRKTNLRPGILFILSDFLDAAEYRQDIKMLAHGGYDVNLIQVLAPQEMKPDLAGDLLLIDSETGEPREVTINERIMTAYHAALDRYVGSLESFCRTNNVGYLLATSDTSFEEMLLKNLIESKMAG